MKKVQNNQRINYNFELSVTQIKKFEKWSKKLPKVYAGAIGGEFEFRFLQTSVGDCVTVKHASGKKLDITEALF